MMLKQQIAHYKITAKLGQGGMGEVYRATDTKLGREVAIKVLPKSFSKNSNRVTRFNREAKTLASLNHPHIAAIYGLEQSGDVHALAMELVTGEDLSQRLKRGPMKVAEAIDVCKQIAEALQAAHEKGIVHRDLKPANVMLTKQGMVKVLDFGLAKATPSDSTDLPDNDAVLPTVTADVTSPGTVIGTAASMSPEQARGEDVDKRSDIWSFGVLMMECLTGNRIFGGRTAADTIAAVLHHPVDWTALPNETPLTVLLLLRRCLAKELQRRLPDISVARIELEEAITDPSDDFFQSNVRGKKTSASPVVWIVAAGFLSMCIGIALGWFNRSPREATTAPTRPVRQLSLDLGLAGRLSLNGDTAVQISPNGSMVAVRAVLDESVGGPQLYIKRLDQLAGISSLPSAEGTEVFAFSPDSRWLAFYNSAERKLQKVLVTGGSAITLCEGTEIESLDWGGR